MATDIIDRYQADLMGAENAALEGAYKNNAWAQTFNSIPPVEKLRAERNLAAQIDSAMSRRMELKAQTDGKAQDIYLKQKAFEAEMALQPLKVRKMESDIEYDQVRTAAVGLTERNKQADDIADLNDLAAFNAEIAELDTGAADYLRKISQVAVRHPRALTTIAGRDLFKEKSKRHQDIASIRSQIGPDMDVESLSIDDEGGIRVTARPRPDALTDEDAAAIKAAGGTVRRNSKGAWTVMEKSPTETELRSLEKERSLHAQALSRAKRIRAKATDENVIKDADNDILESDKALADVESQIRSIRGGGTASVPGKPETGGAAPERTATNPQTGEKLVLRNGSWVPLTK